MAEQLSAGAALSLDALVLRRAAAAPDMPALATAELPVAVTIGGLARIAGAAASYLGDRGIGPGDRVAMWGQNSLAWAVWLIAAAWRGAALVALHPLLGADDLKASLGVARPCWLIADGEARGRPLGALAESMLAGGEIADLRGVTVMPGSDGAFDLAALLDLDAKAPQPIGRADAPLNLQFTSGSTGRPKAVVLSHRALISNAMMTAAATGIGVGDRLAAPLPLYHVAGLSSGLILALATGALWCGSHRFRPDVQLAQIRVHECTVIQGVPTMFKALCDEATRADVATPSLRLGYIGGAPCPPALSRRAIDQFGLERMVITYGQTESGPTMTATRGDEPTDLALTSVGRPLAGVLVRIVDPETGTDRPMGAAGEIWVRTPTLMSGYFGDEAATRQTVTADGWLRTGDIGCLDRGCLKVTSRLKELIIRGGENIAPSEIEDVLRAAPGVADACVVPAQSAHWGEEICAVILASDDARPDIGALKAHCEQRLARFKQPDRYILREEFPALPSGKVDRRAVRMAVSRGEWT